MFFTARNYAIHYEVTGSGPLLILLHGMPMWGDLWRERGYVVRLSTEFTVVTPDLLGHGQSDKPSDPSAYGMTNMATDVLLLLDELGENRAHLWGYSMGAWVAEAVSVLHPQRARSLIFGGNAPGQSAELRALTGQPLTEAAAVGDWDAILVAGLPADVRDAYVRNNNLAAIGAAGSRFDQWGCTAEDLKTSGVPTCVYVGDQEWFIDFAASSAEAAGASFTSVPGDHRLAFARVDNAVEVALPHLRANGR
ncbi:MAG: hypothetical protein QOJ71_2852 [Actinomycetota bacterium]|jgi:pimeloyl-ACP methyl ester carboxylesterase|nr:hypothetical protein [Actinomycetota bacterium]